LLQVLYIQPQIITCEPSCIFHRHCRCWTSR